MKKLVEFGKVNNKFTKLFDIKQEVFLVDFNWDAIISTAKTLNIRYKEILQISVCKTRFSTFIR